MYQVPSDDSIATSTVCNPDSARLVPPKPPSTHHSKTKPPVFKSQDIRLLLKQPNFVPKLVEGHEHQTNPPESTQPNHQPNSTQPKPPRPKTIRSSTKTKTKKPTDNTKFRKITDLLQRKPKINPNNPSACASQSDLEKAASFECQGQLDAVGGGTTQPQLAQPMGAQDTNVTPLALIHSRLENNFIQNMPDLAANSNNISIVSNNNLEGNSSQAQTD